MPLETIHTKSLLENKEVAYDKILKDDNFSVEYYHLFKGQSLLVNCIGDELNDRLYYLPIMGEIEIAIGLERKLVETNELAFVTNVASFDVFAKTEVRILHFSSNSNSVINKKDMLTEKLKEEEAKDKYTQNHNFRVGKYSILILHAVNPDAYTANLRFAAQYHDVGKGEFSTELLNKPGKLNDEEWKIMKMHPIYSYELIKDSLGEKEALIARYHHEKLDGSGYPDGLKEDEIPFESKVLAIADIFDALTTSRSYREAYSFAEALKIMECDVNNNKIDRTCFDALKKLVDCGIIIEGIDNKN